VIGFFVIEQKKTKTRNTRASETFIHFVRGIRFY